MRSRQDDPHRLIITNGDDAVARMREAGIRGEILPWRDILHEGPVPASLALEELSGVRAQFLAKRGWLSEEDLHAAFRSRDAMLRRHGDFETVVLWFAHELCDQLHLIQLLDFFAGENRENVHLIQAGNPPGRQKPKALKGHFHLMEQATEAHFALAQLAWRAFRAETPERLAALAGSGPHVLPFCDLPVYALPFLRAGILRLLEELPDPATGLSRTERTILGLVAEGLKNPSELYAAFAECDEMLSMGDMSFYHALDALAGGGAPLIAGFKGLAFSPLMKEEAREAYFAAEVSCTHLGIMVAAEKADALHHRCFSREIGGLKLDPRKPWRWNAKNRQLCASQ